MVENQFLKVKASRSHAALYSLLNQNFDHLFLLILVLWEQGVVLPLQKHFTERMDLLELNNLSHLHWDRKKNSVDTA